MVAVISAMDCMGTVNKGSRDRVVTETLGRNRYNVSSSGRCRSGRSL